MCQYIREICQLIGEDFLKCITKVSVQELRSATHSDHNEYMRIQQNNQLMDKKTRISFADMLIMCNRYGTELARQDISTIILIAELYKITENYKRSLRCYLLGLYRASNEFSELNIHASSPEKLYIIESATRVAVQANEYVCGIVLMQLLPQKNYGPILELVQKAIRNDFLGSSDTKNMLVKYSYSNETIELDCNVPYCCITDSIITGYVLEQCKKNNNEIFGNIVKDCRFSKHVCMLRYDGQKAYINKCHRIYFEKLMSRLDFELQNIS